MTQMYPYGIPKRLFVENINDEFLCGICRDVLNDPVKCRADHQFCRNCICEWLNNHDNCPDCRRNLSVDTLIDDQSFKDQINLKLVSCKTNLDDYIQNFEFYNVCEWTGQLQQLETHMSNCQHSKCPHCQQHIVFVSLNDHVEVCDLRISKCEYGCGHCGTNESLKSHHQTCDRQPIPCPLANMGVHCGCSGKLALADMKVHITDSENLASAFDCIANMNRSMHDLNIELDDRLTLTDRLCHRMDEQLQVTDQNWKQTVDSLNDKFHITINDSRWKTELHSMSNAVDDLRNQVAPIDKKIRILWQHQVLIMLIYCLLFFQYSITVFLHVTVVLYFKLIILWNSSKCCN